jgi:hypothetical protein
MAYHGQVPQLANTVLFVIRCIQEEQLRYIDMALYVIFILGQKKISEMLFITNAEYDINNRKISF